MTTLCRFRLTLALAQRLPRQLQLRPRICFRHCPLWHLGQRGGVKLGSTTGLVYVGESVEICGGVIHSSDRRRFCCKSIGRCTTKGHKTKLKMEPNIFIFSTLALVKLVMSLAFRNHLSHWMSHLLISSPRNMRWKCGLRILMP